MSFKVSLTIKDVVKRSKYEAQRLGNEYIEPEHFMLGLLSSDNNSKAKYLLDVLNVDLYDLRKYLEQSIMGEHVDHPVPIGELEMSAEAEHAISRVKVEAESLGSDSIDTVHLLLALMHENDTYIDAYFSEHGITYNMAYNIAADGAQETRNSFDTDDDDEDDGPFSQGPKKPDNQRKAGNSPTDTPVLDNFGIDMTKAAQEGNLDPVVGREKEIERLAQILSRRKKNNPILIGEPGVGKSAIVEGLAIRIHERKVSRVLFNKRVVTLDLASIVAGTKYRGQFEERLKSILSELSNNKDIILFIDEIHTIVGAGGASGSLDAANMLKPALARGEIQCIGATTLDEYRQYIEKDGALERRFQKVMVEPTSVEDTILILNNIKDKYESHHNVTYTDEAIKACVMLTERYINDRHLPDKAIDALDEAGSRVHISNISVPPEIGMLEEEIERLRETKVTAVVAQNFELAASFRDQEKQLLARLEMAKRTWLDNMKQHRETVDEEKVAEVVAMMTGVPTQRIAQAEGQRLLNMSKDLKGSVVGQDEAISKVVKAIQRNRAGLKDPNRPIGSFIFLGPTGVGKTHLAQVLAEYLFDSTDALIRIDMSEYMEKFAVTRLIGAPPGYVGYEEGGQLTEKVRRHPYSVVLLDEIEKAHPDVFNLLLQVLDEGRLTDSLGRKVDFKNTIIIMTSNIGSRELKDFGRGVGFAQENRESDESHASSILQKALKKAFAPEFINRIDDIIIFSELKHDDILKIIDIELRGLYTRVESLGYSLVITDEAKNYIADKSYDAQYGARPLKRAIQKYIEDELAEMIIEAQVTKSSKIIIGYDKDNDKIVSKIEN
ncbi:MAG: ATP-dependent Clp protease ATP-binding subunit [Bacteroidales bacterium]|nr:ATP-dependent Clp protease ATP-binding subunit [Bacteroidales bacterium]